MAMRGLFEIDGLSALASTPECAAMRALVDSPGVDRTALAAAQARNMAALVAAQREAAALFQGAFARAVSSQVRALETIGGGAEPVLAATLAEAGALARFARRAEADAAEAVRASIAETLRALSAQSGAGEP